MITTHDVKQGTEEWHALRIGLITASNALVLLTKGKNAARGTEGARFGNYWSERGHILEDEAIEIYEQVKGVSVDRPGFITNDQYPEAGYSPDGMTPERAIEVKCFAEARHLECITHPPSEVLAQIQYGLMVADYVIADLIFYNPDVEDAKLCFQVIEVVRDDRLIDRFKSKLG